jgi:hypothetical protein
VTCGVNCSIRTALYRVTCGVSCTIRTALYRMSCNVSYTTQTKNTKTTDVMLSSGHTLDQTTAMQKLAHHGPKDWHFLKLTAAVR